MKNDVSKILEAAWAASLRLPPDAEEKPLCDLKFLSSSGRPEIVVQAFSNPGGKSQITADGGQYPRWSFDGKELFFLADNKVMSVSVHSTASSFEAATPIPLFSGPHCD